MVVNKIFIAFSQSWHPIALFEQKLQQNQ